MGDTKNYENDKEEVIFIKSKIFKISGIIITLVCFLFITKMTLYIDIDWNIINNKGKICRVMIVLALLEAGCLYLVAYGWSILMKFIEPKDIENSKLISIYIKANIAKYLPGNVMNLVGRNVLAGKLGLKQISITTSTMIEIIIFGGTTMVLAVLFSITKLKDMYNLVQKYINHKFIKIIVIIVILLAVSILLYMKNKKNQYVKNIKKYFTIRFLKLSAKLISLYSIYFIFLGAMLVIVLSNILNIPINFSTLFQVMGFYVISYFIGYITPGAPGGMGVRETVLILLLTTIIGSDLAIAASVIHRLTTIFADVILYVINYFFEKRKLSAFG